MKILKIDKSLKLLLFLIFLISLLSTRTEAKITIHDNWDSSGKLSLESENWTAILSKEEGALMIYSKLESAKLESMRIVPFCSEKDKAEGIISCKVVRNEEKQLEINISFSAGQREIKGNFLFNQKGTVQIKPSQDMKGIFIFSPIEYGVLPSRYLNDNIYDPEDYPSALELYLPSENIFIGLLKGEGRILVCTWPDGNQKVKLLLEKGRNKEPLIQAVEIELNRKNIFLGILTAPGIWHEEKTSSSYLLKDVAINWKKPFSAKWKTQLLEGEFEMSFPFRKKKSKSGSVRGRYTHPVWFEGENPFLHFSKKVVPLSEEILIYALEGHKNTPVEFVKDCLGSIPVFKEIERIPDRPGDNVGINWCSGRDLLNKVFKEARAGIQIREREFLKDIMVDFRLTFLVIKQRIEEYGNFILKMEKLIDSNMKIHLEELKAAYQASLQDLTPQEAFQCDIETVEKLEDIFGDNSSEIVYPAVYSHFSKGFKMWNFHHGGARICGALAIKWYQQAGYSCAENETAVKYAEEIRECIRELKIGSWSYEIIR